MSVQNKMSSILGFLAVGLLSIFGKKTVKATTEDLQSAEFKTSTQRIGVRFTERMRRIFRFKWIRNL